MIWKSLLVLYAKDVLSDLVTVHMHSGQSRWQYCTQVSSMLFGEALSRLYLRSVPQGRRNKVLRDVNAIFEAVRSKVVRGVESAPWMQPQTREAAADKVRRIRGDFLGSDIYFNQSLLEERYRDVSEIVQFKR